MSISIGVSNKAPLESFGPARYIIGLMQKDFSFDISRRMAVIPEVDMFRIVEDSSIMDQVKTKKYEYHVRFDGEYVSGFDINQHPQRVRIEILKGLRDLIKEGKIHWNPMNYKVDEENEKQKKKDKRHKLDTLAKKFRSPEERLVVEAIEKNVGS